MSDRNSRVASALERILGDERVRLLDIGARGGMDPRWSPFEQVISLTALEPEPRECARLNREAGSLSYPARFLPHAVWREPHEDLPFHVCRWPAASSVYEPNDEFLREFSAARALLVVDEVRTVAAVRLDDLRAQLGHGFDAIKLDVEGAELAVLEGGERVVEEALVLEAEVELNPLFRDAPLFADVDAHLRARGWSLLGLRRNSWRRGSLDRRQSGSGGRAVAADVLYWNERSVAAGLNTRDELRLLVALSAYRQHDAVLARLAEDGPLARDLAAAELVELRSRLAPPPGTIRRLVARMARRLGPDRRRALADALQPGDATVWQDPDFF